MAQETIKKIIRHSDYITFVFESGLNSNDTRLGLANRFKEGETINFQSGRNVVQSQYFKLT